MKVNNKGMTLIEVVVSLLILSTASLIMVMGFTTAINVFSDANSYKDVVNEIETTLMKDNIENTNVSINEKSTKYVITESEGETPIEVKGTLKKGKSEKEDNVSLSSFKKGNSDDTRKANKVYNNYCKMMGEIARYLESKNNYSATANMNTPAIINNINEWLKEEKHVNATIGNIVTDLPKLYSLLYPEVEADSVVDKIAATNTNFNKEENHYIIPCLYMNKYIEYTRFFSQDAYKNLVITIGNTYSGTAPETIYAIYKNDSGDKDEWYITKNAMSADDLKNIVQSDVTNNTPLVELNTTISNDSNWTLYTTTKD